MLALGFRDATGGPDLDSGDDRVDLVVVSENEAGALEARTCSVIAKEHDLLDAFSTLQASEQAETSTPCRLDWVRRSRRLLCAFLLTSLPQIYEWSDTSTVHVKNEVRIDSDRSVAIRSRGLIYNTATMEATARPCKSNLLRSSAATNGWSAQRGPPSLQTRACRPLPIDRLAE